MTAVASPALQALSRSSRLSQATAAAEEIAAPLLAYLGRHFQVPGLSYSAAPAALPEGWESYSYTFRLRSCGLPAAWEQPLLLRVHVGCQGLPRVRHEFEVQDYLSRHGYPAPAPLLLEQACDPFGGPFLVMEHVAGRELLRVMLWKPWNILHFPTQMAETHARLHALPPEGFPASAGPSLERWLGEMDADIGRYGLAGLSPGMDWLRSHRPAEPAARCILHLDFHPLNLIERSDGSLGVLDWTYADLGDPHADVATTLMVLACVPASAKGLWERLALWAGRPLMRPLLSWWYRRAYHRRRPLDEGRLAYYRAWSALRQLVRYGRCLRGGAEACGCKPSLLAHLDSGLLGILGRYFRRWSGVAVRL
jgi:aminoglycoside phosphotransferase (APT) family kinase protein